MIAPTHSRTQDVDLIRSALAPAVSTDDPATMEAADSAVMALHPSSSCDLALTTTLDVPHAMRTMRCGSVHALRECRAQKCDAHAHVPISLLSVFLPCRL